VLRQCVCVCVCFPLRASRHVHNHHTAHTHTHTHTQMGTRVNTHNLQQGTGWEELSASPSVRGDTLMCVWVWVCVWGRVCGCLRERESVCVSVWLTGIKSTKCEPRPPHIMIYINPTVFVCIYFITPPGLDTV